MSEQVETSRRVAMSGGENQPARIIALGVRGCEVQASDDAETAHLRALRWAEVHAAVQQVVPGAAQLRQGWCVMRARGPARYYGDERAAAAAVLSCALAALGDDETIEALAPAPQAARSRTTPVCAGEEVRAAVGVANGRFAAEQAAMEAARHATAATPRVPGTAAAQPYEQAVSSHHTTTASAVWVVQAERTADFLAPLPIARIADGVFADAQFLDTLASLGLHTLGAFAAIPEAAVLQRFGRGAIISHRRARGFGELRAGEVPAEAAVYELTVSFEFEPPLDGVDQLAFASSTHAEAFTAALSGQGLVCTELRIELRDDGGRVQERAWSHPGNFTAYDVINRIRWQAATLPQQGESTGAGIVSVRLSPQRTALASAHEQGLWSDAPDERVHHQLTRVQSLLGHEGVGTGVLLGGRLSADRQQLVPWGVSRATGIGRSRDGPWPGSVPGAPPNAVFDSPPPVRLLSATGESVGIDDDELLSDDPAFFDLGDGNAQEIVGWSAPWALRESWWIPSVEPEERDAKGSHDSYPHDSDEANSGEADSGEANRDRGAIYRIQIDLTAGSAWLLRFDAAHGWSAEAKYT